MSKNERFPEEVNNKGLYKHIKELAIVSFEILSQHLKRGEQMPIKILDEISIENEHSWGITKSVVPDLSQFLFNHFEEIEHTQEFTNCINFMMQDDVIRKHFPRIGGKQIGGPTYLRSSYIFPFLSNLSKGNGRIEFDINVFDKVYKEFENYFYKKETEIFTFSPIQNFDCELEEIELKGDMKLRKISKKELEELWSAVGQISHVNRDELLKLKFALETVRVKNKETNVTKPNPSELLDKVVIALRLFKEGLIWPCFIFSKPLSWLSHEGRWSLGEGLHSRGFQEVYFLTKDEAKKFRSFWEKICSFNFTKHSFLDVALKKFNYAYERSLPEDKIMNLIIAFEPLFLKKDEKYRIGRKLSRRLARFLKGKGTESDDLKSRFELIWDKSRKPGHAEPITSSDLKELKVGSLSDLISEIEELLRESIKKFVDLIDQEVGYNHKKFLNKLDLNNV